jgi:hypothetical protein
MISLLTAQKLKAAGLAWRPQMLDCFGIPERGMDEKMFVISDMLATIDSLQGSPVVAFQGASEWALDAIVTSEVVWMPREDQLRQALLSGVLEFGGSAIRLENDLSGCRCHITIQGRNMVFSGDDACEAYAAALLFLLHERDSKL